MCLIYLLSLNFQCLVINPVLVYCAQLPHHMRMITRQCAPFPQFFFRIFLVITP